MVELTLFSGTKVVVFVDKVVYITALEGNAPTKTRIHFIGDRTYCVDVLEEFHDVLTMLVNAGKEQ